MNNIQLLYIDLFCGAGGTSTGVESAGIKGLKIAKVIACVNHDKNAIASHAANHPDARHYTEDIRTLDLSDLLAHVTRMRQVYKNAKVVLWISAECTSHSNAKGGTSRDADSRSLPEEMYRYIQAINPEIIQVENVKEFLDWGPLIIKVVRNKKTKEELYCPLDIKREKKKRGRKQVIHIRPTWMPDPKYKKTYYNRWISEIKSYGYHYDHRVLNAADYGAYTSRNRYFGIFARDEKYIAFPKPTHSKDGKTLPRWKSVSEVLDFSEVGESIFGRKKNLSENTLKRIHSGLVKFVAGGRENFLVKWNSMHANGQYSAPSVDDPAPAVTCQNRLGVASIRFLQQRNSGRPKSKIIGVDRPCRTVTATGGNQELVQVRFLSKYFSGHPDSKNISIDGPAHAIKCKDNHSLITCPFLAGYYGNGDNISSVNSPSPTVTTKDRLALIRPRFIVNNYSGGGQTSALNNPSPAIKTNPNQNIVSCRMIDQQYGQSKPASVDAPVGALTKNPKFSLIEAKWIMNSNFNNTGHSVNQPAPAICASRRHHYLMNPQYRSAGSGINNPCFTLIARMDKKPPRLISAVEGAAAILIYGNDSEMTKKIKEFMALYGIADILMRMLLIPELTSIMGFPKNYKLTGTKTEQKKYIGNAVEVNMAKAMCAATGEVSLKENTAA